ncbi:unnamed protein product [Spirodela intermedia]|uniref:Uncharacterized protein n=1 Tax=Spirodela intermedia TaxID=51605 RepID=A0A7I8IVF6_SPIIN|nr:unnamed protein product [Spirodela intermedia]CAA6661563.1 unnamed protein product [Spirodela intermedia]
MLSFERPPSCSSKIVSPESDEAADPADDGVDESQHTPHFCIRNYVLSSRGEDIGNHWPFSEQYLRLCLKHGVRNLLPPFEPPDLVKARCSRTRLEGEPPQKAAEAPPAVEGGAAEEEPIRRDAPAEVEPSKAADSMAFFKVCPLKPRKKRSMAEILASAASSTLEDLDRRNGTSWAVDLALIRPPAGVPPPPVAEAAAGEGPVYVDSDGTKVRILSKLEEAPPPPLDFDFSPRRRLKLELRDGRSRFSGGEACSPLKNSGSSKGKVHGRKTRSFLRQTGKIVQAMGGELKEEIPLIAQEQIQRRRRRRPNSPGASMGGKKQERCI